jgi:hypothetical protein
MADAAWVYLVEHDCAFKIGMTTDTVVWKNGKTDFVQNGDRRAIFPSRTAAAKQADFLRAGISDEVQSINVLRCPPYRADRGGNDA